MRAALLVLALLATPLFAAETAAPLEAPPSATLTVMNREVMVFRSTLLGNAPEMRAEAAEQRIETILAAHGPGKITIAPLGELLVVKIDDQLAFGIAPSDANPLLEQDQAQVAAAAAEALKLAVSEHAEAMAEPRLRTVLFAISMTAAWLIVLFLLRTGRLALQRVIGLRAEAYADTIKVGETALVDRATVRAFVRAILLFVYFSIVFVASYEWLGLILKAFPYTRPWGEDLSAFLIEVGTDVLLAMASAAPGLFVVVVIIFIARGITAFGDAFFGRVQRGEVAVGWVEPDNAVPTRRLFAVIVWLFALAMAYPYLPGAGSQAFQGLSVLIGLMISLGGASSIGQAASGLVLMYGRALKVGEYVRIGDQEGTVTDIGSFQTRLRTGMGVEVVLPNAAVISSVVHNYSRVVKGQGFIVDVTVTIGYDAPWRQVHALLEQAALATTGILKDPKPVVFQTALSDFYVEYRLVCQASFDQPRPRAEVMSALHAAIQDAFHAAGVQIMSPHYFGDPASPKIPQR
jgi:small-conductance mechanosensitive channel